MAENEQTNVVIKRGSSNIVKATRQRVCEIKSDVAEKNKIKKQQRIQYYNTYGNARFLQEGCKDRLLGKVPTLPQNANSKSDIISYYGGYYEKGNRNLIIYTSGKIPSFISKEEFFVATGYNIDENDEIKLQEAINKILTIIGYLDSQDSKIIYENLPSEVKNNIYYKSAYDGITFKNKNSKTR